MARKCCECGKTLKYFDKWRLVSPNERMCIPCYEKYQREQEIEEKREKLSQTIKSDLSIPELQLQELIQLKNEMINVKRDIHTIHTIVLIWFILGLIGMLISVITLLSIA